MSWGSAVSSFLMFVFLIVEWFISSWVYSFFLFQDCCHKFLAVHPVVSLVTYSNIYSIFWCFYLSPHFFILPFKLEVCWTFSRCMSYAREGGWQFCKVEHGGWQYDKRSDGGQKSFSCESIPYQGLYNCSFFFFFLFFFLGLARAGMCYSSVSLNVALSSSKNFPYEEWDHLKVRGWVHVVLSAQSTGSKQQPAALCVVTDVPWTCGMVLARRRQMGILNLKLERFNHWGRALCRGYIRVAELC